MFSWGQTTHLTCKTEKGSTIPIRLTCEDGVWSISFELGMTQNVSGDELLDILTWFNEKGVEYVKSLPKPAPQQRREWTAPIPIAADIRTAERAGYVYLLHSNGVYKIGHARDVSHRLAEIEPTMPYPVEVFHTIRSEDRRALERELHVMFAAQRLKGEWFSLSMEDVAYIKSL